MALGFEPRTQFIPAGGNVNLYANARQSRPSPPTQAMPVPGTAPSPQAPNAAFNREGQASPNAAFNRAEPVASPNAAFNRPVMMAQTPDGGQYADNPAGQRPAPGRPDYVQAMVPGSAEDQAAQAQARDFIHRLMVQNPEVFAMILQKRGMLPPQAGGPQFASPGQPSHVPAGIPGLVSPFG